MSELKYNSKEFSFENGSDKLYGVLYSPIKMNGRNPTVILSHGYNSSCDDVAYFARLLADSGIVAYCYDFRGGSTRSKSSGKSTDMSIESERNDLKTVIEKLSALDCVDESRLFLYGESQGGFVSALVSAELKERIAGLFLMFPAFCVPDDWKAKSEKDFDEPVNFMGMMLGKPFYNGLPRFDVFEYVKSCTCPVMIFHGDCDGLVKLSYSERLVKCFPNAELTVVKGGGHGFNAENNAKIFSEIIARLKQST